MSSWPSSCSESSFWSDVFHCNVKCACLNFRTFWEFVKAVRVKLKIQIKLFFSSGQVPIFVLDVKIPFNKSFFDIKTRFSILFSVPFPNIWSALISYRECKFSVARQMNLSAIYRRCCRQLPEKCRSRSRPLIPRLRLRRGSTQIKARTVSDCPLTISDPERFNIMSI